MKKIVVVALYLFLSAAVFSQSLEGKYHESEDFLKFENGQLHFDIEEMGSITNSVGSGHFRQSGNFVIVETSEYAGKKTEMHQSPSARKDTIAIRITDHDNLPLQGALVESLSASGKKLLGGVTNADGRVFFLHNSKIGAFRIFHMGHDGMVFDYARGNDFTVKMADRTVVENKQALFSIEPIDEETVSVLLLSTNFEPTRNEQKSMEKLAEKARKRNFLPKRLKKEYVPYKRDNQ